MRDSLRNLVLHLLRDGTPPETSSARESLLQALKRSLDESPTDPLRIAASKRGLLHPSARLSSPDQAILQALAIADHRIRSNLIQNPHFHLLSITTSLDTDFSAKLSLLDILFTSSSSISQDKLFGKIIDGACQQVIAGSTSDCLEDLLVSSIFDASSNNSMIRSALLERLLLSSTRRPLEKDCLKTYQQAFGEVIFELGEAFPSVESAGVALSDAADRWTGGRDDGDGHTREEVKRYVSLGRERVASMKRDGFRDGLVKRAISRMMSLGRREVGSDNCPLRDAMNALSQINPDSSTAKIVVNRLVLHSKPLPSEYSSLMRSSINHLTRLCSNVAGEFVDVEEFACFFAPEVISLDIISSKNDSHENIEGSSSSQPYLLDQARAEDTDKVLRDALMDAVESFKRMSGREDKFKIGSLEAIISVFPATYFAPSMNRDLLRQVLADSKEPPPASMIDEAFSKIIFAAVNRINNSTDRRKDLVDYLLDAIEENQINPSSSMKQALVERLVYSCRPPPAELSGYHVLAASIAGGLQRLVDELLLEQPKEAMAAAISRLPFAGSVVKKTLLLTISNIVEVPTKKLPPGKKEEPKKEEKKDEKKLDSSKTEYWWPCLGPPTKFSMKQKFKIVKPK